MKGRSSVKHEEIIGEPKQEEDIRRIHRTKQVRRRLHTSRPYQERLLNMAEARREIVTALKYHRATMRTKQPHSEDHTMSSNPSPSPSPNASLSYLSTLPLPSQPLGLNLNFNHIMLHLTAATPTPTPSPSPSPPNTTTSPGMHAALDAAQLAEVKSIGEQHQLEYWSDSMSLDWFNFDHHSQSSLFPRMDISGDIETMDDVDDWLA